MRLIDADELKSKIVGKGSDSLYSRLSESERKWLFEIIDSLAQAQPKPSKLDEMIKGYGHTTGIIQIFNEISNQLKELRGERD